MKCKSPRDTLIESFLPLVRSIASGFFISTPDSVEYDDIVSAGHIGLVQAADNFASDRGVRFGTYATTRIRGAILDYLRSADWASRSMRRGIKRGEVDSVSFVSLDCELPGGGYVRDLVADPSTVGSDRFLDLHVLRGHVSGLSRIERRVIGHCYFHEGKAEDLAVILGFTGSYISIVRKRALLKLRKSFASADKMVAA